MIRRDFLKTVGLGAGVLAAPAAWAEALSGLSGEALEAKVKELLGQMTLEEKILQMHGHVPGGTLGGVADFVRPDTWNTLANKRLGIPGLRCIDGPRGVGKGKATCFPVSMCRGATFDPELEEKIGAAMGYETRALGANVLLEPCINVVYHPAWGRAQESYGEDPWHLGVLGAASVRGVQKHAMACPKHYAVNNIEESRMFVNAVVDERTLREIFLPHFKQCVDAGAATVMSAYNDVNGFLCAHNRHLLRDILKDEWGFTGFVVSDWVTAVEDTVAAAEGGLDVEMPTGAHFGPDLLKAVKRGQVPEKYIDEAVTRILRQKFRFLQGDDPTVGYDAAKVASREHTELALECARKGIVLLKNENTALPLERGKIKTLAVLGAQAAVATIGDLGSSAVTPPYAVSPLEGLQNRAGGVRVVHTTGSVAKQVEAARAADAVVLVVGLDYRDEGEGGNLFGIPIPVGGDRPTLGLHPEDEKLILSVAAANPRTVVVVQGGSAITMGNWKDKVSAIVMAWYPGLEGGNALADILFGEVNPSGKLPLVFPASDDQLWQLDNRAKEVRYDYYHGYRYFEKKGVAPAFAFGFGLSYTTFAQKNLRLDKTQIGRDGKLRASLEVTNTGNRAGDQVVQLYVGAQGSKVDRPVKELKGFARVSLAPGETKTVTLEVAASELVYFNTTKNAWEVEAITYTAYLGSSSREADLVKAEFQIV